MSHRQFYSSLCGEHDSCEPIKKFRDAYHPLFEKYGVDVLFSGHAHNYQRTYPLFYNDVNSSEPIIEERGKTFILLLLEDFKFSMVSFDLNVALVPINESVCYGFPGRGLFLFKRKEPLLANGFER